MMHARLSRANQHHRGVALVEVLVAVLLFALGVVALVGLQGALTKSQTDAKIRTDAAALANEVIGQMWSEMVNLDQFHEDSCASHSSCASWQNKVASIIPSGEGLITTDNATGDVSVTVTWTLPNGASHQYVTQTNIAP